MSDWWDDEPLGKRDRDWRPSSRGTRTGGPMLILVGAFGAPLPAQEQALWDAMSDEQRETAILRLTALLKVEGMKPPAPEAAAAEAKLSINRWYELAAAWREKRSLSSIGIAAAKPRRRTLANHEDLERLVVPIVDADPEASVRQLSFALGEAYAREVGAGVKLPSENTLRRFVELELRRSWRVEAPGSDIMFDCSACLLPHSDGVFTAFLILDKGSRVVLGAALGEADASRAGYALAAKDALERMKRAPVDGLNWAEKLKHSELVIGLDESAWSNHAREMKSLGMRNHLQPVTKAKRFGAFVRPLIGARMGRVKFLPGKTSKAADGAQVTPDDVVRLGVEIDLHNADLIAGPVDGEGRKPPAALITLLKRLAKG